MSDIGFNAQDNGDVTGSAPKNSTYPTKSDLGFNAQENAEVPGTSAPSGDKYRGGPAEKAPSGKGVVESGGGSFGQN